MDSITKNKKTNKLKIALVHDYLIDYGGAEVVLFELHKIYPEAPIYVSILDKNSLSKFWDRFSDAKIICSWFDSLPFASKIISPLRFLLPIIWAGFDFSEYDIVISSASWAVTKGFGNVSGKPIEICYCHTPPRYLYGYDTSRNWKSSWFSGPINIYALVVNHFMRMYDFTQSQKVNYFVANSKNVAKRIEKFYRRDSVVIYPPVEMSKVNIKQKKGGYYLTGGRMVAAKNFDLIIKTCNNLKINLKIFGSGVEENHLRNIAGPTIEFLGKITNEARNKYMANAIAFIAAQKDEDFGITLVESMVLGTPVIAYKGGGYEEIVTDGKTGVFFDELTEESLSNAIERFKNTNIKQSDLITFAKKFSSERFRMQITEFVNKNRLSR